MTVDNYLLKHQNWLKELEVLRGILLSTKMDETIKWGVPVYTFQGKNIVGLGAFKKYMGLWFYQGALLSDNAGVLQNAQEGKTQAMRQWRFTHANEIDANLVRAYINEAIENQKLGKEIVPQKKPLLIPRKLKEAFNRSPEYLEAFENFGLTQKRDFCEYIQGAKRDTTKQKRLEKVLSLLKNGVGLNDKYKR